MTLELKQPTEQQWLDFDIATSICDHGNVTNLINLEHLDIQSRLEAIECYLESFSSKQDSRYTQAKSIWNSLLDIKISQENNIANVKTAVKLAIENNQEIATTYKSYRLIVELLDIDTIGASLLRGHTELDAACFDYSGNPTERIIVWINKTIAESLNS